MNCPILLYHGIDSAAHRYRRRSDGEMEWVIDASDFERQMQIIAAHGFEVVTLDGLRRAGNSDRRLVVLTFDDGHETTYLNALPILQRHGYPAEIFVTSGWIDTPKYLSAGQLRELHRHGFSIQSHGVTHRFLSALDEVALREELEASRETIAAVVAAPVRYLSYPGGRFDERAERSAALAGYEGTCTSERGWNRMGGRMFALRRQGISRSTTDEEFRAMLTMDGAYFRRRRWKRGLVSAVRSLVGGRGYQVIRRMMSVGPRAE